MYIHEKCVCGRLAFLCVFRAMVTRQVAANVVPFLLKEIEKKSKQKWLFLNVLYNLPCSGYSVDQSINKFISRHSTEASATVRLCPIKEKCLETDLKCVNGWRNSTVQWKRVPKSRSSNRETTSSSVQGTDRNFCVDDRSKRDWLYGLIRSAR